MPGWLVFTNYSIVRLFSIAFFAIFGCLWVNGQQANEEELGARESLAILEKQSAFDADARARLDSLKSGLTRIAMLEEISALTPEEERELAALKLLEVLVSRIEASHQKREEMRKELKDAPATKAKLSAVLEEPLVDVDLSKFSDWEAKAIKVRVDEIAAKIEATENLARNLEAKQKDRSEREFKLPTELSNERRRLAYNPEPEAGAEAGDVLAKIQNDTARAKRLLVETTIATLELEQLYIKLTGDVLQLGKRASAKSLVQLRKDKNAWDAFYAKTHATETENDRKLAENQAKLFAGENALGDLTREIKQLADRRQRISQKSIEADQTSTDIALTERDIEEQRKTAQEKISLLETAGLKIDTLTGQNLRSQRAKLPTVRALTAKLNASVRESTRAQVELLVFQDDRDNLPIDIEAEITTILADVSAETVIERSKIRELLDRRRELLGDIIDDYKIYISSLNKAAAATRLAIDEVENYASYLDARLLWIASAETISARDFRLEWSEAKSLSSAEELKEWGLNLFEDLKSGPVLWLIVEGFLIYLVFRRKKIAAALGRRADEANQASCQKISPTIWVIFRSIQLAAPIPLALWFFSWRVQDPVAIDTGITALVAFFAVFGSLSVMSRPDGLLANHFGMPPTAAAHLHYHLRWFLFVAFIPKFFAVALPVFSVDYPQVGRVSFILLMVITLVFSHLTLRPGKRLLTGQQLQHALLAKSCWMIGIGAPLLFIVGSCLGYNVSIESLNSQAARSVDLVLATVFVALFFLRWLKISQVRLKLRRAEQREAAERSALEESEGGEKAKGASLEELKANAVNSAMVEEQTTRLVRVASIVVIGFGLWSIWSTSLTALSVLDRVKLWEGPKPTDLVAQTTVRKSDSTATATVTTTTEKTVDGEAGEADGVKNAEPSEVAATQALSEDQVEAPDPLAHWITLQDLLAAIIIVFLTIVTARNFPGFLELTILRRFNSKPGANYAVTTLLTYAIIAAGLMLALHRIGVTWSSLQWLAAAITLGIGFGLQEIFANFVAGIIILFEQPIRLGDVVTVDGVTGKVTRIEIRATTILKYDNKEMLVPNKDLITGTLVNWTLKDNVQRFEFPVGVSYDTEPDKVTEILKGLLEQHPNVVSEPPPSVLFMDFGESTMDFEVRAHVASPDNLLGTQSQLHYQIAKAFKEAGISFAFPQQDLHIRSVLKQRDSVSDDNPALALGVLSDRLRDLKS